MTSGNGIEPSGEESAADPVDGVREGPTEDSADATVDPTPPTGADRPRTFRRKAGVVYRPV